MTTQVCPYLRTVDDPGAYFPTPDVGNFCYADSSGEPAHIARGFQERICLAGQSGLCSRYRAAERLQTGQPAPRWILFGGGLAGVVLLAGCALLAVLVLILGGLGASRMGLLARATDTPSPTATPSPTWTPTTSSTPTEQATSTATVTPQPSSPTATVSAVSSPGDAFVSPLATPAWQPTAAQPWPTATRRPLPTATRPPAPTFTRGPTLTPSATSTRTPTATPQMTCRVGDTMTFSPASPLTGKTFIIEVRSLMGYVAVLLTGAGSPDFNGVDVSGSYYIWRWEDRINTAGTYTYSFQILNGAATCLSKSVTVLAPTNTPTPTPTVTPVYEVGLALIGDDDFRPIFTDTQPVIFDLELTNRGNVSDTFKVWLEGGQQEGWTAEYCIGSSCSDSLASPVQVTLPAGGSQALSIKLIAPAEAQEKDSLSTTLRVQSLGDQTKEKSQTVTVVVTKPTTR